MAAPRSKLKPLLSEAQLEQLRARQARVAALVRRQAAEALRVAEGGQQRE